MSAENATIPPQFSIIVPVYNDWETLQGCLQALDDQTGAPTFEVIVVDDGSQEKAPDFIRQSAQHLNLSIVRQAHLGIGAARNRGIQNAKGAVLVFTDADCRVRADCLAAVAKTAEDKEGKNHFQLCLVGDPSTLVGSAEDLRLRALQQHLVQPDGRILYLNTSGFAIRRIAVNSSTNLFDPSVQRCEDTLLLTDLIKRGELPFFVSKAVVRHALQMTVAQCLRKDLRVAWFEAQAFQRIAARGLQIRRTNWERFGVLRAMWRTAHDESIGRMAWCLAVVRQILQRSISFLYNITHWRSTHS